MPPNVRLWLAKASLCSDGKGRTSYSASRYAKDTGDSEASGDRAVTWILGNGYAVHDVHDNAEPCLRLCHYDFGADRAVIRGYGRDAGMRRDGLPPAYGRTLSDVVPPPYGNLEYVPAKTLARARLEATANDGKV